MEPADVSPLVPLPAHCDERGLLVAIEGGRDIPFPIARVYYILGSDRVARGFHAHRELEQVAVSVSGSCRMVLDDGTQRSEVLLDRPDRGIHIGRMIWHEMHDFSADSVLLVLASAAHDEADYIRDYPAFLSELAGRARS